MSKEPVKSPYSNDRAAIGQATNLACSLAIQVGKPHDIEYLIKQFLFYRKFAALMQAADDKQLAAVAKSPTLIDLFEQISKEMAGE